MPLHPMLLRQLERAECEPEHLPTSMEAYHDVLNAVSRAYTEADQERYLLRRSQELASRELETTYLTLLDAQRLAGLGNWHFDITKDEGEWSDGCIRIFGLTNYTSLTPSYSRFLQCIYPKDRANFMNTVAKTLERGESFETEFRVLTESKDIRWVQTNVQPSGTAQNDCGQIRGTIMDITKHKQLEEQLMQSQKMEAIGTLVGGIAHDFNNILAAMQGSVYLAKRSLDNKNAIMNTLQNVDQLSNRAADMVSQLLTFARKGIVTMKALSLNAFLDDSLKLTTNILPENIESTFDTCHEKLVIRGDVTQLQQLLLNLFNNAGHAVSKVESPKVKCSLDVFTATNHFLQTHDHVSGTHFAKITVQDNGCGINDAYLNKIFEPFFTTKEVGEGTGLGLAMAYGSIRTHGGTIEVDTKLGEGTSFHVYLPLINAEIRAQQDVQVNPVSGNQEMILLVDDEVSMRETIGEVIRTMGYQVIEASDGQEALNLFKEKQHDIALVISDIVMPKLGGIDAVEQMRGYNINLPIILMTGYDKNQHEMLSKLNHHTMVLSKPFSFDILSQNVRSMIEV